uniref:Uncharacterized protein n=1 Tax=Dunaliella tertiolecta TaxID=3047 RepID=A0A7S3VLJ1_DUNTE
MRPSGCSNTGPTVGSLDTTSCTSTMVQVFMSRSSAKHTNTASTILSSSALKKDSTAQPQMNAATPSVTALVGPDSTLPNCRPPTPHMLKPQAAAATNAQF